ncbi:Transcriptional regulatory protein sin3 [Tulasnella sp. 418]|nr:Transcriptional regulatory protein sin3 [Tulasnella sp. 418]
MQPSRPPSTPASSTTLPPISAIAKPEGMADWRPPQQPQTAVPPAPLPAPTPSTAIRSEAPAPNSDLGSTTNNPPPPSPAPLPPPNQWPVSAVPPAIPVISTPVPEQSVLREGSAAPPAPMAVDRSGASSPSGGNAALYRPLNVKDALSYLEMVKVKFQDQPDVYNHFLDIMKDFKSQAIDTPGVIERVSTLFTGHPTLIQGFNTFLPQGYRIECTIEGGDNSTGLITVTTPSGTTTQTADGRTVRNITRVGSATTPLDLGPRQYFPDRAGPPVILGTPSALTPGAAAVFSNAPQSAVPPPFGEGAIASGPGTPLPGTLVGLPNPNPPVTSAHNVPIHSPHPTTPGIATLLGGLQPRPTSTSPQGQQNGAGTASDSKRPVEFNHAINYVNKIKNRFANDPDTYKQFLEILQTYQKEQRPIRDVYDQVTILFNHATDLLDEFKQFLPDPNGSVEGGSGGLFGMIGQMTAAGALGAQDIRDKGPPPANQQAKRKKRALDKEPQPPPPVSNTVKSQPMTQTVSSTSAGMNAVTSGPKQKKSKHHHSKPDAPSPPPYNGSGSPPPHHSSGMHGLGAGQTTESAFFERVKKYIDDRTTYHEFLKLLHLFTEEIIDARTLIHRAGGFLGGDSSELMNLFKEVLMWDERVIVDAEMSGNGLPGTSGVRGTVGLVPTMDRPKVDLNTCKKYGPSYRKLPKHEISLACSGRDSMCWEVLNDEWVSHPTWASEDAGFSTHKKNAFEDALHKSEEERHEYDFHIEALIRTINVLEPIHTRINHMDPDERASFKLKPGLGGQGKSIYQRIVKKIYGRDHGLEVITALHESPAIAVPVVLARLKQKEEEWKRAQREWNKVWREVDARNFYKSLDHQGINFKVNDKKSVNPKQLVLDIETKRREVEVERAKSIDPAYARTIPRWHYQYQIEDAEVLKDSLKLVFGLLDRAAPNSSMAADAKAVETFLRTFVPLFFGLDEDDFCRGFGGIGGSLIATGNAEDGAAGGVDSDVEMSSAGGTGTGTEEDGTDGMQIDDDDSSVSGASGKKRLTRGGDLRKKLLKGKKPATASGGANTSTTSGRKSAVSSRRGSPAPASAPLPATSTEEKSADKVEVSSSIPIDTTSDHIWIKHGPQEDDVVAAVAGSSSRQQGRKGVFFANNAFYVLMRNLQLLYSRLHAAKQQSVALAAPQTAPGTLERPSPGRTVPVVIPHAYLANPLAVSLGLADATGPGASRLIPTGSNPATYFYEHTLDCCEQLFDGEMDQGTFEDHLRFMYGIKAYPLFTIDKVVGSIIKQVQSVLADVKNKELLNMLRKERTSPTPYSIQEQINARRTTEQIIGAEENVYRITWIYDEKTIQIQLLAKEDASTDEAETITDRWKQYMASYVLRHETEGLPGHVSPPLLSRSLLRINSETPSEEAAPTVDASTNSPQTTAGIPAPAAMTPKAKSSGPTLSQFRFKSKSGIAIKVCVRTYRMFFESSGEDWFFRKRTDAEEQSLLSKMSEREADRAEKWKAWYQKRAEEIKSLEAAAESAASAEDATKSVHTEESMSEDPGEPQVNGVRSTVNGVDETDGEEGSKTVEKEDVEMDA